MDTEISLSINEQGTIRTISKVTAHVPPHLRVDSILSALGNEVCITDIYRGVLPQGEELCLLKLSSSSGGGNYSELNRFSAYLHHGLDGKQPPKAGCATIQIEGIVVNVLLISKGPSELVILDPSTDPPAPAPLAHVTSTSRITSFPPRPPPPTITISSNGHGQQYVPSALVTAARDMGGARLEAIIGQVADWISSSVIPFPYRRAYTSVSLVQEWFDDIVKLSTAEMLVQKTYTLHGYMHRGRGVKCITRKIIKKIGGEEGGEEEKEGFQGGGKLLTLSDKVSVVVSGGGGGGGGGGSGGGGGGGGGSGQGVSSLTSLDHTSLSSSSSSYPSLNDDYFEQDVKILLCQGAAFKPFDKLYNERGANVVDFFTESARMAARRRDSSLPPVDEWRLPNIARAVVAKAIRKFGEVTDYSLRHGQYGVLKGACNLFHANLARSLIHLFGGTRVLDPCAGWGDRLIGAMASPGVTRYLAFDPNTALVKGHTEMIQMFSSRAPGKGVYNVVCAPFEHGIIPEQDLPYTETNQGKGERDHVGKEEKSGMIRGGFDLILTSPPYFDLEIYEDVSSSSSLSSSMSVTTGKEEVIEKGLNQSIVTSGSKGLNPWLTDWYFPMMSKAWAALVPGGHMAIYINDHEVKEEVQKEKGLTDLDICVPMLTHAATLDSCEWVGCLGIEGETGSNRPLWIWRKGDLNENGYGPDCSSVPPLYSLLAPRDATISQTSDGGNLLGGKKRPREDDQ
jgi:hypothetical protein